MSTPTRGQTPSATLLLGMIERSPTRSIGWNEAVEATSDDEVIAAIEAGFVNYDREDDEMTEGLAAW